MQGVWAVDVRRTTLSASVGGLGQEFRCLDGTRSTLNGPMYECGRFTECNGEWSVGIDAVRRNCSVSDNVSYDQGLRGVCEAIEGGGTPIALPSPEILDDEPNFMNMINTVEEGEEREDDKEVDTVCGDDVKIHGENYEMPDSS